MLDLGILETNHAIAVSFKLFSASLIVFRLLGVNATIKFDKPVFGTVEIGDELPQRMLPPELEAAQPMGAQAVPEHDFGGHHLLAQFFGPLLDGGRGADMMNAMSQ